MEEKKIENSIENTEKNNFQMEEKGKRKKPHTVKIPYIKAGKKARIWEIDFLRAVCVLLMVFDHLAMLLAEFGMSWYGWNYAGTGFGPALCKFCDTFIVSETHHIIKTIVLFVFFSISGISCTFSKNNFKRGGLLALVALIYTGVSYGAQELFQMSGIFVTFGVLHFLAFCILLYALIELITKRNKIAIIVISAVIIIVVACLYYLYNPPATTPKFFAIFFPPTNGAGQNATFYHPSEISPGDLFTIIPYASFFFAGTILGPVLYSKRRSLLPKLNGKWMAPFRFIGSHALIIYVLHVVVLTLLLALISFLFVTPGQWGIF